MEAIVAHAQEKELLGQPDAEGRSPLHYAAVAGAVGVLEILLDAEGCVMDALDDAGLTPISYALAAGRHEAATLLLSKGASCKVMDKSGNLAVSAAVSGRDGYQLPLLPMESQGSRGSRAPPFWSSSTEILSGERTKAM